MTRPISSAVGVSFAYGIKYKSGVIHKGVDFSRGREGEPVYAMYDAVVTHAGYGGWGPAYGQHVILRSAFKGKTKWHLYGHLQSESVRVGQAIKAGQQIGASGGGAGRRYSGNSTGPHLHAQVGYQNRYDRYEDPWPMINAGATTPPPVSTSTPPKPLVEWGDGMFWNLAASDKVRGKASWDERMPKIIKAIAHYKRTILQLVEVETEGAQGRAFAAALDKAGYKIAVADNQRMIAVTKACKVGHTKVITLDDHGPAKDDKQIVLAEIWTPGETNALAVECGHLEYREGPAYDRTRANQAKQTRDETIGFAGRNQIPGTRVIFANDENARIGNDNAFGTTFPSLRSRKDVVYGNEKFSTLCGWSGSAPAKSSAPYDPDKVRVHKDRQMVGASTSLTFVDDELSDHCPVVYTLAKN
jgi:hypothetical protein